MEMTHTTEINIAQVTIRKASGHGNYVINGLVNGEMIEAKTFNSEAFDYLNSNDEERHNDALLYCEMRLEQSFNRLHN